MPQEVLPVPEQQVRLERMSEELLSAVDSTRQSCQNYYGELAQDTPSPELEHTVQSAVGSLKRTAANLTQALQETLEVEDELRARYQDLRKSKVRKWYRLNPPANAEIDLEEQTAHHFARGNNLYKLLLVCFVGSFAGVVSELVWCLIKNGYLESRSGLVYGPFNLLYGAGAVVLTMALYKYRNRGKWLSFLGGFLVGSALEYLCSWGQELILGTRSWDYTGVPFNLNGRICLLYSLFWGVLGVVWIKDLYPRMSKWILKVPNKAGKAATIAFTVFFAVNIAVTCVSVYRWTDRIAGNPADSGFWEFVDERFPNERMEKIFANMVFVEE